MNKTFIIAEIGVNHNADFELAVEMIEAAANCGVDAIKFQTAVPELVQTSSAPKADYQKVTTGNAECSRCRRRCAPGCARRRIVAGW